MSWFIGNCPPNSLSENQLDGGLNVQTTVTRAFDLLFYQSALPETEGGSGWQEKAGANPDRRIIR